MRISLDPHALGLGPLPLPCVGIFTVAGATVGVLLAVRWCREAGLPPDRVYTAALWAIFGGFAGARLLHVLDFWGFYWFLPLQTFYIWNGGLSLWGGILGGSAAVLWYAHSKGLPALRMADLGALAALAGQAVGRIGDVLAGERVAKATSWPWGFTYTHPDSASYSMLLEKTHPAALYELLWDLAVFALLWRLRRRLRPEGTLFLGYLVLYALGRSLITSVRVDREWLWGLQGAQVVALVVLLAAAAAAWHMRRPSRRAPGPLPPAPSGPGETPARPGR